MTDYSKYNADRAVYTFSIQPNYHSMAANPSSSCRSGNLPSALNNISDLNFLDPNCRLFHTNYALLSAGHFSNGSTPPGIATTRDRSRTMLYGDSGGYQIITGVLPWRGDQTRAYILRWLEQHCDVAMTLDVPTRAIDNPRSQFRDFPTCLNTTLANLAYFQRNRTPGKIKLLNVLQGRDRREADAWYQHVKAFKFEGWAFAGKTRLNFADMCRRLIIMIRDGEIGPDQPLIHVLGTCRLEAAVILTAIQRELRRLVHPSITITYDASTPALLTSQYAGYGPPIFTPNDFRLPTGRFPRSHHYVGSQARFPFDSAIGRSLRLGDLCVNNRFGAQAAWDGWSGVFLVNHNLDLLLSAIDQAHRILDMRPVDAQEFAPVWMIEALEGIRDIFGANNPLNAISRHRAALTRLVSTPDEDDSDDGRGLLAA